MRAFYFENHIALPGFVIACRFFLFQGIALRLVFKSTNKSRVGRISAHFYLPSFEVVLSPNLPKKDEYAKSRKQVQVLWTRYSQAFVDQLSVSRFTFFSCSLTMLVNYHGMKKKKTTNGGYTAIVRQLRILRSNLTVQKKEFFGSKNVIGPGQRKYFSSFLKRSHHQSRTERMRIWISILASAINFPALNDKPSPGLTVLQPSSWAPVQVSWSPFVSTTNFGQENIMYEFSLCKYTWSDLELWLQACFRFETTGIRILIPFFVHENCRPWLLISNMYRWYPIDSYQ